MEKEEIKTEEYNFLEMGMRYANEQLGILREMARKIGKKYGKDARLEFESGVAIAIPIYPELENKIPIENEIRDGRRHLY